MKINKYLNKNLLRLFILKKNILQQFKPYAKHKKILFIVGCQRSGTTLMTRVFRYDLNSKIFGEYSKLSSQDERKNRLNPLHLVKDEIYKVKAPLIILKPLVESQNILKLLEYFKGSKALWIYRDYKDVALSNLKKFGMNSGINDLRPIVENNASNWRSDKVQKNVRDIIVSNFSENMNPYDAAVLFWYARNCIYIDLELDNNPNVLLCKYEDLITSPTHIFKKIYKFLNQKYPGPWIHKEIHSKSLSKGQDINLSPEVDQLAKRLLDKLNKIYQAKNA